MERKMDEKMGEPKLARSSLVWGLFYKYRDKKPILFPKYSAVNFFAAGPTSLFLFTIIEPSLSFPSIRKVTTARFLTGTTDISTSYLNV